MVDRRTKITALYTVVPDMPFRIDVAAAPAYPDKSMTISGVRGDGARWGLEIERTAGKDYTTSSAIDRMRIACRQCPKAPDYGLDEPAKDAILTKLVDLVGFDKPV